nr:hypothetical protein Iba_chr06aCG2230 [Ipomoea batatas]
MKVGFKRTVTAFHGVNGFSMVGCAHTENNMHFQVPETWLIGIKDRSPATTGPGLVLFAAKKKRVFARARVDDASVGLHNLLLFGSDILTREIAMARTSTKLDSSPSSNLPDGGVDTESSLKERLAVKMFLSDSDP